MFFLSYVQPKFKCVYVYIHMFILHAYTGHKTPRGTIRKRKRPKGMGEGRITDSRTIIGEPVHSGWMAKGTQVSGERYKPEQCDTYVTKLVTLHPNLEKLI